MIELFLDTETYSETPIKHGTYRYAENAEVMIATYAINDGPVEDIDFTRGDPADVLRLRNLVSNADVIICHNTMFDRNVLRLGNLKIEVPIEKFRCSMVKALLHGLPGGLDKLCDILGVPTDLAKHKTGRALIHLFCKPIPFTHAIPRANYPTVKAWKAAIEEAKKHWQGRATRETHPVQWAQFIEYARADIPAMREVWRRLPSWNYGETGAGALERDLWHLDQKINDRGVCIDLPLVHAAIRATNDEQTRLKSRVVAHTDGYVEAATQRDRMLEFIFTEYGIGLADLTKSTVTKLLEKEGTPPELVELLQLRAQASQTSTAKYNAFARGTSEDGRLRGMLQFSGAARTRRDAGRTVQLQNLPSRGLLPQSQIEIGIEALLAGCEDLAFDNIMLLTSSAIRSVIVAPKGKKLVVSDLANIEGRGLAWLAGEEWKLQAFRDFDTILGYDDLTGEELRAGPDLYKLAYAKAFSILVEEVTKFGRSIGKVMELACFSPETKVLTNNGVKAIVEVSNSDLLWDGISWVQHQGVVERSARQTVNADGINLTPDHLILVGQTWTPALELATSESTLSLALATGSENLPSLATNSAPGVGAASCMSGVPVEGPSVGCISPTFARALLHAATRALRWLQLSGEKSTTGTPTSCQTVLTGNASLTVSPPASIGATTKTTKASRTMAGVVSEFLKSGALIAEGFWPTLLRSLVGTYKSLTSIGKMSIGGTNLETCDSLPDKQTASTSGLSEGCKNKSQSLRPVFDILNAGPRNRFTVVSDSGYLVAHNCGYQGGIAAFATFSLTYGLDLEDMADTAWATLPPAMVAEAENFIEWLEDKGSRWPMSRRAVIVCEVFKRLWREAHPMTVQLWAEMELGFKRATNNPGQTYRYRGFAFRRDGMWLRIRLPSGRYLCYPSPQVDADGQCSFMGVDQFTRKWTRVKTYGGKLTENATQSVARDFMFDAMPGIEAAGYEIVLRVHDEVPCYAPDRPEFNAEHLSGLLATNPPWAPDMPLAAAGFEGYRYKKD